MVGIKCHVRSIGVGVAKNAVERDQNDWHMRWTLRPVFTFLVFLCLLVKEKALKAKKPESTFRTNWCQLNYNSPLSKYKMYSHQNKLEQLLHQRIEWKSFLKWAVCHTESWMAAVSFISDIGWFYIEYRTSWSVDSSDLFGLPLFWTSKWW